MAFRFGVPQPLRRLQGRRAGPCRAGLHSARETASCQLYDETTGII